MISPSFRKINLQAYKPGRSIIKRTNRVIKLSANESALGISNRAKRVLKTFNSNVSKYPDGKFKELTNTKLIIKGADNKQTATESEIVFITVPYEGHQNTLIDLKSELSGKIVVDTVVPLKVSKGNFESIEVPSGSAAEEAFMNLPNSHVIGAFHNVSAVELLKPTTSVDCDVIITGNDSESKNIIMQLAEGINGIRAVDGGRIENTKQSEDLTILLLNINKIYKKHSMIKIVGL